MADPRLTDLAASLPRKAPFTGPEAQERARGAPFRARLGANESGFGPSPRAVEAMQRAASDAWMYPDSESHDLRAAIAGRFGIARERIVVGAGIDGLLGTLVRLTVAPGTPVVSSQGAYPTFDYHVRGFGGVMHKVPFRGDHESPEALIAKAREVGAKLVYLSNPDNPMGSWHTPETVARMAAAVPEGALMILDEAYAECSRDFEPLPWGTEHPNVIRMRTFSKAYGLAGARIGYAVGPRELIADYELVREHFGIGRISQEGALAAFNDRAWLNYVQDQFAASRARLAEIAQEAGLVALPSAANFVAIDAGSDGAFAAALAEALMQAGLFVRQPGTAPLDRAVRISCGPEAEMDMVAEALPTALAAARRRSGG